jgi:hypothetical protein
MQRAMAPRPFSLTDCVWASAARRSALRAVQGRRSLVQWCAAALHPTALNTTAQHRIALCCAAQRTAGRRVYGTAVLCWAVQSGGRGLPQRPARRGGAGEPRHVVACRCAWLQQPSGGRLPWRQLRAAQRRAQRVPAMHPCQPAEPTLAAGGCSAAAGSRCMRRAGNITWRCARCAWLGSGR